MLKRHGRHDKIGVMARHVARRDGVCCKKLKKRHERHVTLPTKRLRRAAFILATLCVLYPCSAFPPSETNAKHLLEKLQSTVVKVQSAPSSVIFSVFYYIPSL